jgi:hypothetical protein
MRYRAPVVAAIAFTLLLSTRLGFAKGPPDRIIISGGGLAHPIEITDSLSRLQFNPWAAAFANLHSPVRDSSTCALAPYDVRFYMRWPGRHSAYDLGDKVLIYALTYCPESGGAGGTFHLPGPGQPFYDINVSTILRRGQTAAPFPPRSSGTESSPSLSERAANADAPLGICALRYRGIPFVIFSAFA